MLMKIPSITPTILIKNNTAHISNEENKHNVVKGVADMKDAPDASSEMKGEKHHDQKISEYRKAIGKTESKLCQIILQGLALKLYQKAQKCCQQQSSTESNCCVAVMSSSNHVQALMPLEPDIPITTSFSDKEEVKPTIAEEKRMNPGSLRMLSIPCFGYTS